MVPNYFYICDGFSVFLMHGKYNAFDQMFATTLQQNGMGVTLKFFMTYIFLVLLEVQKV